MTICLRERGRRVRLPAARNTRKLADRRFEFFALQNHIKKQAHDHPRFRAFAARYGQMMHQINMRTSVALLRDPEAERRAKEKAEAPTVKTEAQTKRDEEAKAKELEKEKKNPGSAATAATTSKPKEKRQPFQNIWTRKFRPLPEEKAVDLFADVVGDTFILGVAVALILYEYWRAQQKPDSNKEKIEALGARIEEREERLRETQEQLAALTRALAALQDPKTKKPLLPSLQETQPLPQPTAQPAA